LEKQHEDRQEWEKGSAEEAVNCRAYGEVEKRKRRRGKRWKVEMGKTLEGALEWPAYTERRVNSRKERRRESTARIRRASTTISQGYNLPDHALSPRKVSRQFGRKRHLKEGRRHHGAIRERRGEPVPHPLNA